LQAYPIPTIISLIGQGEEALAALDELIEEHFGGKAAEGRSKAALVEVVKGVMEERMENLEPSPEWLSEALRVRIFRVIRV
jgi:hypothetical protein